MYTPNLENNRQNSINNEFVQNSFGPQARQETVIIKKKKRQASFERRFLSAQAKGENCVLEVAMMWNDNVLNIQQYEAKPGQEIAIGESSECQYHINMNGDHKKFVIAHCEAGNQWKLIHLPTMKGFVLEGSEKIDFSTPTIETNVTGSVRAKYIFGDVSILIHYADKKEIAAAKTGFFKFSRYGALAASLLLHLSLFSVILLASDRVDALMIDRIMTNTRFALLVEQEEQVVEEDPIVDEVPPEDTEVANDTSDLIRESSQDTPIANNAPSNAPMSKSEAVSAAMQSGLLNQATAMNSMLAAVSIQEMNNTDWNVFDPSMAAQQSGYGLAQTGPAGGNTGIYGRMDGGFGPQGTTAYAAVKRGAENHNVDLGKQPERQVKVPLQTPDTNGGLDKRLIQKVVKQHTGELRSCYERELNKVKGLNGRVVLLWTISPQGSVTKVVKKETTMNNKNVEDCLINSVKYWRFPVPKNGGMTMVEYPFIFTVGK